MFSYVDDHFKLPNGLSNEVADEAKGMISLVEALEHTESNVSKGHVGCYVCQDTQLEEMGWLELMSVFVVESSSHNGDNQKQGCTEAVGWQ